MNYLNANKWDISNRTQNNCLSQDTNNFFSVEEELILYKKHILAAKLYNNWSLFYEIYRAMVVVTFRVLLTATTKSCHRPKV